MSTTLLQTSSGFAVVGSFEAIYAGMFGPQQADANVTARVRHLWLEERNQATRRALADLPRSVEQWIAEIREREASRRAEGRA